MIDVPDLITRLAGDVEIVRSQEDLDDLPPGSVIYTSTPHHDAPVLLVKDICEKLYLGSPCEWFTFSTRAVEILLMEDTFPRLPALLLVRGDTWDN